MITGFNTDIEHGGVIYHVQTEDKGLETPLILSLVYVGGAILASKRASYQDLIETGYDVKMLTERLQRQHKLICAAIRAGRIEDLKRMAEKDGAHGATTANAKQQAAVTSVKVAEEIAPPVSAPASAPKEPALLDLITDFNVPIIPEAVFAPPPAPAVKPVETEAISAEAPVLARQKTAGGRAEEPTDELYLSLIDDEGEFRAGQFATIKIYVGRGMYGKMSLAESDVTVKILGTSFRPLIISTKTDENGFAVVRAHLPHFTSGRAAIVIRAVAGEDSAELRRIIHQL